MIKPDPTKKILHIDMDGVLVDFKAGLAKVHPLIQEEYLDREDEIPGIFSLMPPMEGAVEAFHELSKKYNTYILSTAPWENHTAWMEKLIWVKNYLGEAAYKRLTISHNKHLAIGDFLIDDRPHNGAKYFQGEWIHFGSDRFPDWKSVVNYLSSPLMHVL